MAAFQLFNYSKPGPGVQKNAPPKKRYVLFFELFFRKFTDLIKLNLLFLIPVAVALVLALAMLSFGWPYPVDFLPFMLISPFAAGLTYVTRNYAREEHAFIFSDFKDTVKSNWKQFMIHGAITYVFITLMYVAVNFYTAYLSKNGFFYVPLGICCAVSLLFLFMQYYIPIMIITFDLKLKAVYKNAMILSVAGMGRNFLLTIILAILTAASLYIFFLNGLGMMIIILIAILFTFSFTSFLINFTIYPLIEKYMIKPLFERNEEPEKPIDAFAEESLEDESDGDAEESAGKEGADEKKEEKTPKVEYEYIDGRLVRKYSGESIFEDKN